MPSKKFDNKKGSENSKSLETITIFTGEKFEVFMVRREISSTLGRKTAICELTDESDRRVSHGDSWTELLKKKAVLWANAIPKVKPSDFWTTVSAQGENTLFVSLADSPNGITHKKNSTSRRANDRLRIVIAVGWNETPAQPAMWDSPGLW